MIHINKSPLALAGAKRAHQEISNDDCTKLIITAPPPPHHVSLFMWNVLRVLTDKTNFNTKQLNQMGE
jgi:hypothetical protein